MVHLGDYRRTEACMNMSSWCFLFLLNDLFDKTFIKVDFYAAGLR
jgi:hypothetical protein